MCNSAKMWLEYILPEQISEKSKKYNRYVSADTACLDKDSQMKFYDDFITIYVLTKCYYEIDRKKIEPLFEIYTNMYYANRNQIISEINSSKFSDMCLYEVEKLDNNVERHMYEKSVIKSLTCVIEKMLNVL